MILLIALGLLILLVSGAVHISLRPSRMKTEVKTAIHFQRNTPNGQAVEQQLPARTFPLMQKGLVEVFGEGRVLKELLYVNALEEAIRQSKYTLDIQCIVHDISVKDLQEKKEWEPFFNLVKRGHVKLFRSTIRPETQFGVIDGRHVYIQERHEHGDPERGWYFQTRCSFFRAHSD